MRGCATGATHQHQSTGGLSLLSQPSLYNCFKYEMLFKRKPQLHGNSALVTVHRLGHVPYERL